MSFALDENNNNTVKKNSSNSKLSSVNQSKNINDNLMRDAL